MKPFQEFIRGLVDWLRVTLRENIKEFLVRALLISYPDNVSVRYFPKN